MSSISALGSSQYNYTSPLQQLEAELQSEVSAGTISSSDQSALSSALTSINSSLTADQSSSAQTAGNTDTSGGTRPHGIRAKINDLIQAQVSSGALTNSQATELQSLFANTFGHGPGGRGDFDGAGGPGGPQGLGGPPPGPPPSGGGSTTSASGSLADQLLNSSSSTDASSGDGSSTDSTSLSTVLQDFLKLLQDAQSYSYGANGATAPWSSSASTLINYQA
jgi:hypothetical protein